jgi:hypothetical protein
MDYQELRRLKELEEENRRLKHMYAKMALDNKILKDVLSKKFQSPASVRTWLLMWWNISGLALAALFV